MLRLFLAVAVNDQTIVDKIEPIHKALAATNTRMSLVRLENLHFTLKFLGNTSPSLVEPINAIMSKININSFQIELNNLGCFPRPSHPRVIWLGLTKGHEQLASIASFLDKNLKSLGFAQEKRSFKSHLTLARVKSRIDPKLTQLLKDFQNIQIGSCSVNQIVLKQSTLTPQGPNYDTLKTISLL